MSTQTIIHLGAYFRAEAEDLRLEAKRRRKPFIVQCAERLDELAQYWESLPDEDPRVVAVRDVVTALDLTGDDVEADGLAIFGSDFSLAREIAFSRLAPVDFEATWFIRDVVAEHLRSMGEELLEWSPDEPDEIGRRSEFERRSESLQDIELALLGALRERDTL